MRTEFLSSVVQYGIMLKHIRSTMLVVVSCLASVSTIYWHAKTIHDQMETQLNEDNRNNWRVSHHSSDLGSKVSNNAMVLPQAATQVEGRQTIRWQKRGSKNVEEVPQLETPLNVRTTLKKIQYEDQLPPRPAIVVYMGNEKYFGGTATGQAKLS
jgi:hypothetical protein